MNTIRFTRYLLATATGLAGWLTAGCTPDEEHRDIPPAQAAAVTAEGLTLDGNATPQQVAYVFLRSVADDVNAAQKRDRPAQKKAMRLTHSLIAYNTVEQRLLQVENLARGQKKDAQGSVQNRTSLGDERDEKLWDFSRQLAPIIAHYVPSFDTSFEGAAGKMRQIGALDASLLHIYYDAAYNPAAGDPDEKDPITIDIELAKEPADGRPSWRVAKVSFAGRPGKGPATRIAMPRTVMQIPSTLPSTATTPAR